MDSDSIADQEHPYHNTGTDGEESECLVPGLGSAVPRCTGPACNTMDLRKERMAKRICKAESADAFDEYFGAKEVLATSPIVNKTPATARSSRSLPEPGRSLRCSLFARRD